MSRSIKKPILKDKPRNYKRTSEYWRKIRRNTGRDIQRCTSIPKRNQIWDITQGGMT